MKRLILAATAAIISTTALAADLPVKAPALPAISFSYPALNGIIVEAFTEGGGSSVVAQVPGVPAASLTTTTAGVGGTLGYMWTPRNSPVSVSFEGRVEAQNFNGNQAGFTVQGPLRFEEAVIAWAPWQRVFAALPNIWNPFASISPFSLPTGFTPQGNAIAGLGFYYTEVDISTAFAGVQSGKVWQGNPGLVAMTVQPVTGGGAFRVFAKWDFLADRKIFGQVPTGQTTATLGSNGFRGGVGYAF